MIELCIDFRLLAEPGMHELASKLQQYLDRFDRAHNLDSHLMEPVQVVLMSESRFAPFRVLSSGHIVVSTENANEIAGYVGIRPLHYLEMCIALAFVQRTALKHNRLLIGEDLVHPPGDRCVFNCVNTIQCYALEIEELSVCPACREFYRCLKCEFELEQVDIYLKTLRNGARYCE